jgi:UDP-N-acetylglucosamine kinase
MTLEETEGERIFWERIVPDELTGSRQEQPVVVFVVGQPGDGKALVSALVRGVLERRGQSVMISAERYQPYHPGFHALAGDEPEAGRNLGVDGYRWMAMAVSYVVSRQIDAVIEFEAGGLEVGGLEELAGEFKAAGYQVEVAIIAVPDAVSRFGVLERHIRALEAYGYGRLADRSQDDFVVPAAEASEVFADRVAVLRPDAHLIYGNQRDSDGRWQQPAKTVDAINWERDRPWTVLESRLFLEAVSALERTALAAPVPWIRREAVDGVKAVTALAGPWLHPDAVTLHIATAGVSTPQY